jgi:hypothetical protein
VEDPISMNRSEILCSIDGSYSQIRDSSEGGAAIIMMEGEQLITYLTQYFQALSPLHTEVQAMEMAIQEIIGRKIVQGHIITDCKEKIVSK